MKFFELLNRIPVPSIENGMIILSQEPDAQAEYIESLSKVNILVGPNNSGKSKILREVLKSKNSIHYFSVDIQKELSSLDEEFREKAISYDALSCFFGVMDKQHIKVEGISKPGLPDLLTGAFTNARQYSWLCGTLGPEFSGFTSLLAFFSLVSEQETNIFIKIRQLLSLKQYLQTDKSIIVFRMARDHRHNPVLQRDVGFQKYMSFFIEHIEKIERHRAIVDILQLAGRFEQIYIPTLRTANRINPLDSQMYSNNIKVKYGFDDRSPKELGLGAFPNDNIQVATGETIYQDILSMLTGSRVERDKIRAFEDFLSREFFLNQSVELIPRTDNIEELHISIGGEQERPIYDVGDGLQMIIIMTLPLFQYERGIIVIEEPELFIHPGLQKTLMRVFLEHELSDNFSFFLSTHSNHILDEANQSEQASITTVTKVFENKEQKDACPDFLLTTMGYEDRNALTILGVSNSSVYLSNCTIWVEGVTDRLYLHKYIQCYLHENEDLDEEYEVCQTFKEGLHYSFIYTAGDNIRHYSFEEGSRHSSDSIARIVADNLCGKALVIVDNDSDKNVDFKDSLREALGDRFIELPVIEVENLLSGEAIRGAVESFPQLWSAKSLKEGLDVPIQFDSEYTTQRLGSVIEKAIKKAGTDGTKKSFAETGGKKKRIGGFTLRDKHNFAKRAVEHITYENMTENSKEIVCTILDFLLEQNHRHASRFER